LILLIIAYGHPNKILNNKMCITISVCWFT